MLCALIPEANLPPPERLYREMKRAYSIRSKVLHGDTLSDGLESEIRTLCKTVDEILRCITRAAIDVEWTSLDVSELVTKSPEEIDDVFLKLAFRGMPTAEELDRDGLGCLD